MNKNDLVEAIADQTGLTKAGALRALDAATQTILNQLKEGDSVTLPGFGTFNPRNIDAREGRNPRSGEKLMVEASKSALFKLSPVAKKFFNQP